MTVGTRKKTLNKVLSYVVLVLIAFLFIAPIYYLFLSSLKTDRQIIADMSTFRAFLPTGELSLDNYVAVLEKLDFLRYFKNSVIVTVIAVCFGTIINAMMGYALAVLRFKGRKQLVSLMLALAIVPTESVIINRFMVVKDLGLLDSYAGLALPMIAYPMYIFLYYNHFKGMPVELIEAALVDGENHFNIFWKIMLPLSKPICTTVAIMSFIRTWGNLLWPTLVTRTDALRTLPQAINNLSNEYLVFWGQIFAFASMMTLPVLLLFLLFQKQFIQSMAMTGIKG